MFERNWTQEIDSITEKFRNFESLSEEEFNFKIKNETWSIAQNIAHIILLNNSYFEAFKEILDGKHNLFVNEGLEDLASNALRSLQPYTSTDRFKRANTLDIWQPTSIYFKTHILREFERCQLNFKNHIVSFKDFPMDRTYIKYPGYADLIFKLDDCINFLIDHENRHWNQAYEIVKHFEQKNG
jgi:hypothetical protein